MQTGPLKPTSLYMAQHEGLKSRIRRAELNDFTQNEILDAGLRALEPQIKQREARRVYCGNGYIND